MKEQVWISWDDGPRVEYTFNTNEEMNAFLKGISEAAERSGQQFEQFDDPDGETEYVVKFTATFEATISVKNSENLDDVIADITIPESDTCLYKENTFKVLSSQAKTQVSKA